MAKKDFFDEINRFFTLENSFLPNAKNDSEKVRIDLHRLNIIDPTKFRQYPSF